MAASDNHYSLHQVAGQLSASTMTGHVQQSAEDNAVVFSATTGLPGWRRRTVVIRIHQGQANEDRHSLHRRRGDAGMDHQADRAGTRTPMNKACRQTAW